MRTRGGRRPLGRPRREDIAAGLADPWLADSLYETLVAGCTEKADEIGRGLALAFGLVAPPSHTLRLRSGPVSSP